MTSQAKRAAVPLPRQHVDVRGCAAFRWAFTSQSMSDPVVCRLPPTLTTYVIYPSGKIQKHFPKITTPGYYDAISYQYLDAKGSLHELGTYRFRTVQRYLPGNVAAEGESRIVDLRTVVPHWRSGTLMYGFSLETTRPFIGDVALASLLGAMLEVGFNDIVCTGFSTEEGRTARGSTTHVNGTNGDFRYLRNDGVVGPLHLAYGEAHPELLDEIRQAAFIEALFRFGWKSLLSYRYELDGETRLLKRTRHYRNHYHHLHLQGYSPTAEEIHD